MRERGEVSVVADQIGTPTSAASVARAAWALAAISSVHGIYHWTDSGVASWYDFAVAIAQEAVTAGLLARPAQVTPITTEDHPTLARRPRFSVLDKSSTVRAIGIVPPHWRANLRPVLGEIELG
jgi:dTDP-4-dehydrorhamnose reductase